MMNGDQVGCDRRSATIDPGVTGLIRDVSEAV